MEVKAITYSAMRVVEKDGEVGCLCCCWHLMLRVTSSSIYQQLSAIEILFLIAFHHSLKWKWATSSDELMTQYLCNTLFKEWNHRWINEWMLLGQFINHQSIVYIIACTIILKLMTVDSIKNSILPDIKKNWDSLCRAITRLHNKSCADRHSYYAVLLTNWIKPS
jgi:hypothetical protein